MLRTDHNQRPAVKPDGVLQRLIALTDITTINLGKRHAPHLLQCHSVLTFRREVFQAKLLAVGIPPTGKKLVASGACFDLSFWV